LSHVDSPLALLAKLCDPFGRLPVNSPLWVLITFLVRHSYCVLRESGSEGFHNSVKKCHFYWTLAFDVANTGQRSRNMATPNSDRGGHRETPIHIRKAYERATAHIVQFSLPWGVLVVGGVLLHWKYTTEKVGQQI